MIKYEQWNENSLPVFPAESKTKGALETLQWAYNEYGEKLTYACSFGIEGIVLIDLISKVQKDAEIVFLDTGYHFKETYELIEEVKKIILLFAFSFSSLSVPSKNKLPDMVKIYGKPTLTNAATLERLYR